MAVAPRALFAQTPTIMNPKSVKPVVIASANGNKFKNGGDMTCVQKAFTLMTEGGADVLENTQPLCTECSDSKTAAESLRGRRRAGG